MLFQWGSGVTTQDAIFLRRLCMFKQKRFNNAVFQASERRFSNSIVC